MARVEGHIARLNEELMFGQQKLLKFGAGEIRKKLTQVRLQCVRVWSPRLILLIGLQKLATTEQELEDLQNGYFFHKKNAENLLLEIKAREAEKHKAKEPKTIDESLRRSWCVCACCVCLV